MESLETSAFLFRNLIPKSGIILRLSIEYLRDGYMKGRSAKTIFSQFKISIFAFVCPFSGMRRIKFPNCERFCADFGTKPNFCTATPEIYININLER